MKQRLSVRAIINQDNKTLVVKRASGRETILGKFELPGGKLAYSEQPEDAIRRYLHDDLGLEIATMQLFDAVTYIDKDDRAIQYGVIVYFVTPARSDRPIKLNGNYSKYRWLSVSESQQNELTDLTQLLLGIIQQEELTESLARKITINDDKNTSPEAITVYTDGGSRGNPGPSAAGYVMVNHLDDVIDEGGEYLGITTNNQAEYHGVRLGLERAIAAGHKILHFKIDSMLVVNQLNGIYKIKNRDLWPVHERIRELMKSVDRITFNHVPREFNQLADGMVNKTLDQHGRQARTDSAN